MPGEAAPAPEPRSDVNYLRRQTLAARRRLASRRVGVFAAGL